MKIRETFVDLTQGSWYESGWYIPFTDDRGQLYKSLAKEYGRCVSRVYVDMRGDGKVGPVPIGWVFLKRVPYDTSPKETYLQETWVEYRYDD